MKHIVVHVVWGSSVHLRFELTTSKLQLMRIYAVITFLPLTETMLSFLFNWHAWLKYIEGSSLLFDNLFF